MCRLQSYNCRRLGDFSKYKMILANLSKLYISVNATTLSAEASWRHMFANTQAIPTLRKPYVNLSRTRVFCKRCENVFARVHCKRCVKARTWEVMDNLVTTLLLQRYIRDMFIPPAQNMFFSQRASVKVNNELLNKNIVLYFMCISIRQLKPYYIEILKEDAFALLAKIFVCKYS